MKPKKALAVAMAAFMLLSTLGILTASLARAEDVTPPTVISFYPEAGSPDESITASVGATFSELMDTASVESAFSLSAGGISVAGTFNWAGGDNTFQFFPSEPLQYSTEYTIAITPGAKDQAGNQMVAGVVWTFSTMAAADPPYVASVSPVDGQTGVDVGTEIQLSFSRPMNTDTIAQAFSLSGGGENVQGSIYTNSDINGHEYFMFTPSAPLKYSTEYTISVSTAATDTQGQALAASFSSKFTTSGGTTSPSVTKVSPADGETGVNIIENSVGLFFSEPMNKDSVQQAFSLSVGGERVAGVFEWYQDPSGGPDVFSFRAAGQLQPSTEYTITLGTGAMDLDGNHLASEFTSRFTTEASGDRYEWINVTSPSGGETWRVGETHQIDWSVAIPSDWVILDQDVLLMQSTGSFEIAYPLGPDARSYSWTIPSDFGQHLGDSIIQVQVHVREPSGEEYHHGKSHSFTMAAQQETSIPTVVSVLPADGATDVDVRNFGANGSIAVFFSEPMDKASVESAFSLSAGETTVPGGFGWSEDGTACIFVPSGVLSYSTSYNVKVDAGARSAAGVSMSEPFTSGFRTLADTSAPIISDTRPSSPVTLYTNGASATQYFMAYYSDDVGVTLVMAFLDGANMTEEWAFGTEVFDRSVDLGAGQHTLVLEVRDAAGNKAVQTWDVTVLKDTTPPVISGYINGQQIKDSATTPTIGASFSDSESGVLRNRTVISIDGKDVTRSATYSAAGFTYPTNQLSAGKHTVSVTIYDVAGNSATASWSVQVMAKTGADTTQPAIKSIIGSFNKRISMGTITATYSDAGSGVNTNAVFLFVDNVNVTASCTISGSQIVYSSASLTSGSSHLVHLEVKDKAGNSVSRDATVVIK